VPTLIGPAVDPTLGTAFVEVDALEVIDPVATPPAIDPDAPWDPVARAEGRICSVVIGRAITREVIGALETAVVEDFDEDVEMLVGGTASIVASSWDPLWETVAVRLWGSADGHLVGEWDPKGYVVWIEVDGATRWTGVFRRPIDIGDGRVMLPAVDPSVVFRERILGRGEQLDLLEDRGSFEDYDSIDNMIADGWSFDEDVEPELITGGVRGTQALRVTGNGWVRTPEVTLEGADGYRRTFEAAVFGRFHTGVDPRERVLIAYCRRSDSTDLFDAEFSFDEAGVRGSDEPGWSKIPAVAGGRMSEEVVSHRCWSELRSFDGGDTDYDLATLRQGVLTGFPPGADRDWAYYVERVVRDVNSVSLGGSPTGLRTRIESVTGNSPPEALRWPHNQLTPLRDVLSQILDVDGGPECRITPGWWIEIHERLGADRSASVCLDVHTVASPGWATDPSAQIEDFIADTGIGTGTSRIYATVAQPYDPDRHRITAVVQAPVGRSLNETNLWTLRHARVAARLQASAQVRVPWAVAEQLDKGDDLWLTLHDGLSGIDRAMRIVNIRWLPEFDAADLTLGDAGA
jgi:hypothetical protein